MIKPQNTGAIFVVMGAVLFFAVAGEFAIKGLFVFLSLVCVDYGLRLMGYPPLFVAIQNWFDNLSR
jgi:hypothetical protein